MSATVRDVDIVGGLVYGLFRTVCFFRGHEYLILRKCDDATDVYTLDCRRCTKSFLFRFVELGPELTEEQREAIRHALDGRKPGGAR